ncbi:DNA helicase, partial [Tanacetum coccineum]
KIVLAVASSCITSLLLPAGRTAHSRFKLPLELTDESLCHVKKNTQLGNNGETGEPDNEDDQDSCWLSIPPEYCGKTYLSKDEAIPMGKETSEIELLYPMMYLNTISFPGFPPHELHLKVGSLIMLLQEKCVLEARVYCKWVFKSIPQKKEIAFCCILIDRENNAIQANMEVNNTNYFNRLLQMQMVYRITNFTCENTKQYLQTLENKISLKFRKITSFHALPKKQYEFPEHHFEFVAYNQLSSRVPYLDENSKTVYPRLTGQGWFRKVDIENLDGNVVEFTMWDDLAKQFNKEEIEKLLRPIIIAVSSCKVPKYRDLQLSATSATYYYINPQTPEAKYAYTE